MTPLPWARSFRRRCTARLDRRDSPTHYGRCELERDHRGAKHALERGQVVVLWSIYSQWTGPEALDHLDEFAGA